MELVSPNYIKHYFWVISQQLGLKHYYLVGESFACYPLRYIMDPNPLTENILVNIDGLKKALSVLGEAYSSRRLRLRAVNSRFSQLK
jgi:hypothetical protein